MNRQSCSQFLSTFLLLLAQTVLAGLRDEPDVVFASQFAVADARSAAHAGGGAALLQSTSAVVLNPAFPNAYHKYTQSGSFVTGLSYGRGVLFEDHILQGITSWSSGEDGTLAGGYRFLQKSVDDYQHEVLFNYSSKVFEKNMNHGAVDFGMNLRYARTFWSFSDLDSLPVVTTQWQTGGDTTMMHPDVNDGDFRDHRVVIDVGFYQPYLAERLDFGLTFHNLLGYVWRTIRPYTKSIYHESDSTITVEGETFPYETSDTLRYVDEYTSQEGWLNGAYRSMTVGVAFRTTIVGGKVGLIIPADLGLFGLFDQDIPAKFHIRTGAEASIGEALRLRFGYAYAPSTLSLSELADQDASINKHVITGGAGLRVDPLSVDLYVGSTTFGLSIQVIM